MVVGSKVYTLEGHEAELDKLAGERATVKGEVTGETVARSVCLPGQRAESAAKIIHESGNEKRSYRNTLNLPRDSFALWRTDRRNAI